ncbi:MAG: cobyrinate a,c-diamide synthase [Tissierellia bacterium]|nr:cobyrinate a,c-diamide synthase [Tissierellia bacterium]
MKGIMITADRSNSGKTVLNLAILRALSNRGIDVSAFKTGPDYIDPHFSSIAARKAAHNLDIHLMGRENMAKNLSLNLGEFAVVEGAMGYFDGNYLSYENSSYDISVELNLPAILVYTPKGEAFSIVPKLLGMKNYKDSKIEGIIFNKINKMQYNMYKKLIEDNLDIKVLGYMPYERDLDIDAVNLGLNMEYSKNDVENLIEKAAKLAEQFLNLDEIINLGKKLKIEKLPKLENYNLKFAIAKDRAFCFHYQENIKLLKLMGDVIYFSPLKDSQLPEADMYFLGGGYPENFANELSANKNMREKIYEKAMNNAYIYAEGGALMYLSESLMGKEMVGVFKGDSEIKDKLQNFGYCIMEALEDNILALKGEKIFAKEFHYGILNNELKPIFKMTKPNRDKSWEDGYQINNCFGSFQHFNWLGNIDKLNRIANKLAKEK